MVGAKLVGTADGLELDGDEVGLAVGVAVGELVVVEGVKVNKLDMETAPCRVAQATLTVTVPVDGITKELAWVTGERVLEQLPPENDAPPRASNIYSAPEVEDIEMVRVSPGT